MERITINIGGAVAPVRTETLDGREHIVAPMVMMGEGVWAGSQGPLFYPAEELSKAVPAWNHKPIVVYHPEKDGMPRSAADPAVLNARRVGLVLNTRYDNKQRAEAWFDVEKLRKVDERVLDALRNNEMMEVSTGVYTENERKEGEFNGKQYQYIARNHRPDHLAILPDKIGAYSIADGGGLLQLNELRESKRFKRKEEAWKLTNNQLSYAEITQQLYALLSKRLDGRDAYIEDVYTGWFVFCKEGSCFKMSWAQDKDEVVLVGEPEEVREVYVTVDGAMLGNAASSSNKENNMTKKEHVDHLIANAGWEETDRDYLMGLSESKLAKLVSKVPTANADMEEEAPRGKGKKGKKKMAGGAICNEAEDATAPDEDDDSEDDADDVVENQGKGKKVQITKQVTANSKKPRVLDVDSYINNEVPEELRGPLRAARDAYDKQRKDFIDTITANERNMFTREFLETKELEELRALAEFAGNSSTQPQMLQQPSYFGAQGGPPVANAGAPEPLPIPAMSFGK